MRIHYIFFIIVGCISSLSAQKNADFKDHPFVSDLIQPQIGSGNAKAVGDTIFLFDGYFFAGSGFSLTGLNPFQYYLQDLDNKTLSTIYTTNGYPNKASYMISRDVIAPGDTNFYLSTISDFIPTGQANDWVSLGPISIPAGGATLSWKHSYVNFAYRDGYKVHVSTAGLGSANFTGTPLYSVNDNDASTTADTSSARVSIFFPRSVSLAAFAGQSIYLGFEHNANNMDILFIDDILIKSGSSTGIDLSAGSEALAIYPNPSSGIYTVKAPSSASKLNVEVYNMIGELVYSNSFLSPVFSIDLSDLRAGVYTLKTMSSKNEINIKEIIITK